MLTGLLPVGRAEISTAMTIVGTHRFSRLYGNWADQAAIHILCSANGGRYKNIRNTARGTYGLTGIAFNKVGFTSII